MKLNEVAGTGNWNTALYWEYHTRSTHRANPDPVRIASHSPYAVFDGNPIWKSDVNGDFSKAGAWTRNLLQGGSGITKMDNGEWGFSKSGVLYENGEKIAFVKMTFNDGTSRRIDDIGQKIADRLNNSWMGRKGTSFTDGTVNMQKVGTVFTSNEADGSDSKFNKALLINGTQNIDGILNLLKGAGEQGNLADGIAKSAELMNSAKEGRPVLKKTDDTLIFVEGATRAEYYPKKELGETLITDPNNITIIRKKNSK
jgi:hypothetical protein